MKSKTLGMLFVLAAAGGCGDDGAATSDARIDTVTADVAIDGPATSTITVDVVDKLDQPIANALVIFGDADGNLVGEKMTDAQGRATQVMADGGTATAVVTESANLTHVVTFTELWPSASVVAKTIGTTAYTSVNVSWTAGANMNSYQVFSTCPMMSEVTTAATSTSVMVESRCASNFDVVIYARDTGNGFAPMGASATLVSTPSVTVPNNWANLMNVSALYMGVPTNLAGAAGAYAQTYITQELPPTGCAATSCIRTVAGDGSLVGGPWLLLNQAGYRALTMMQTTGFGLQYVDEWIPPPVTNGSTYIRNLSGILLPFAGTGLATDLSTRIIRWGETAPAGAGVVADPDAAFAQLRTHRGTDFVYWHIVTAGSHLGRDTNTGERLFALPDIPGTRTFEPIAGDTLDFDQVVYFDVDMNPTGLRSRLPSTAFSAAFGNVTVGPKRITRSYAN